MFYLQVIETFHEGRKEASSGFMAHALIRGASQTLLNIILGIKKYAINNKSSTGNSKINSIFPFQMFFMDIF